MASLGQKQTNHPHSSVMVYASKNNTSYVEIPVNAVDEDVSSDNLADQGNIHVEGPISDSPPGRTAKSLGQSSTPIGIFSLGFVAGALTIMLAQSLYHYRIRDVRTHQNVNKSNLSNIPVEFSDAEPNENDAVSYNFLRTTKGSSTIRILLKDLFHPNPEGNLTQSTESEVDDYERLGGPRRALTHLIQLMKDDGQIHSSCHPLAHNLGRAAYEYFGSSDAAFDSMIGTDDAKLLRVCNAAYLHGVIKFHLRDVHDVDDLIREAAEIQANVCSQLTNVNLGTWECQHGIGHGIIQRLRMDGEQSIVKLGIEACEKAFPSGGSSTCENGLWMDHFAVSGNVLGMETRMMAIDILATEFDNALNTLSVSVSSSNTQDEVMSQHETQNKHQLPNLPDPSSLQMCDNLSKHAKYDCYLYMPTEYLLVHPGDYLGALSFCQDSSANISTDVVNGCVAGVGMQCAKEHMDNFLIVENVCETLDDRLGSQCFRQAVSYYTMSSGGTNPRSAGVCDELVRFKSLC
eukprot:CCRYP_003450-RA/>CCRYP_003450-RA protein AED:0.37 eAED:0.37 QI:32/1/1/1/1/1/2/276/516